MVQILYLVSKIKIIFVQGERKDKWRTKARDGSVKLLGCARWYNNLMNEFCAFFFFLAPFPHLYLTCLSVLTLATQKWFIFHQADVLFPLPSTSKEIRFYSRLISKTKLSSTLPLFLLHPNWSGATTLGKNRKCSLNEYKTTLVCDIVFTETIPEMAGGKFHWI